MSITPFQIRVPDEELEDLRGRLAATRFIAEPPVSDWRSGVPIGYLRSLLSYWRDGFETATRVHREAHGLIAHTMYAVEQGA